MTTVVWAVSVGSEKSLHLAELWISSKKVMGNRFLIMTQIHHKDLEKLAVSICVNVRKKDHVYWAERNILYQSIFSHTVTFLGSLPSFPKYHPKDSTPNTVTLRIKSRVHCKKCGLDLESKHQVSLLFLTKRFWHSQVLLLLLLSFCSVYQVCTVAFPS